MSKEIELWIKKILILVAMIAIGYVLYMTRSLIAMILVSAFITMLVIPLVDRLEKKHVHPAFTLAGVYAMIILIVVIIVGTIIPILVNYITLTINALVNWTNNAQAIFNSQWIHGFGFHPYIEKALGFIFQGDNFEKLIVLVKENVGAIQSTITKQLGSITSGGIEIISNVSGVFFNWILIGIMAFMMTLERKKITQFILDIVPDEIEGYIVKHYHEIQKTLNTWIKAMLMLSFSIFFLTYVGLTLTELIFGFDTGRTFTLALIAGIMEFIPYIWPIISLIPALIIGLGISWKVALIITVLYILIQQAENNFLVPYIMSRSLDLSPFLVFIVMIMGATLWGVLGIILAVPIAAIVRILYIKHKGKKEQRRQKHHLEKAAENE